MKVFLLLLIFVVQLMIFNMLDDFHCKYIREGTILFGKSTSQNKCYVPEK